MSFTESGARTEEPHVCDAGSRVARGEHHKVGGQTDSCLLSWDVIDRVKLS